MKQSIPWRRVVWAVDPFAQAYAIQGSAAWALKTILAKSNATVEPVYLFNYPPTGVGISPPPEVLEQTRQEAEDAMTAILRRVRIPNLLPLRVIVRSSGTMRQGVQALLDVAQKDRCDLLVVSSRARKAPARWILGSFAETLVLRSDIPVLVVNPVWKGAADFRHILFPTDFSDESRRALDQVIDLAKFLKSEITIFHAIPKVIYSAIDPALPSFSFYRQFVEENLGQKEELAKEWAAVVEKAKLKVHTHLDHRSRGTAADAILAYAKKRPFLVAIAAQSSGLERVLLGGTTLKVLRGSPQPVWVFRP